MNWRVAGSDFNQQIYEEASNWFVEMRAGDIDQEARRQFDAWVRKSPEHLRAYLEISEIWDDAPAVDAERKASAEMLIEQALQGADVIALDHALQTNETTRALRTGYWCMQLLRPRFVAAAAVALVAASLAAWFGAERYLAPVYSTGIGEQKLVVLADGSRVELNARTRLEVHFGQRARHIDLLEGQALFKVAKDAAHPFVVTSGDLVVRAVGTEFDVDRKQSATTVTVLEGRVAVRTLGEPGLQPVGSANLDTLPAQVFVGAGEQVSASGHRPPHAARANVAAATAWTHGSLVFEGSRLADVVEEFNRYNEQQLVVGEPRLNDMLISGVYTPTDPALLVRFLREQPTLRLQESGSTIVIGSK